MGVLTVDRGPLELVEVLPAQHLKDLLEIAYFVPIHESNKDRIISLHECGDTEHTVNLNCAGVLVSEDLSGHSRRHMVVKSPSIETNRFDNSPDHIVIIDISTVIVPRGEHCDMKVHERVRVIVPDGNRPKKGEHTGTKLPAWKIPLGGLLLCRMRLPEGVRDEYHIEVCSTADRLNNRFVRVARKRTEVVIGNGEGVMHVGERIPDTGSCFLPGA